MNTPSHAIANLALLGSFPPETRGAILAGAILPDLPIFGFYIWAKWIERLPEREIWTQAYYQPGWQMVVALFHSFPIAAIGWAIASGFDWQFGQILCLSLFVHSCFDLPVHHDDAHRHFFPFSNYRFISPLSYWDPKHHGAIVAAVEVLFVLACTIWLFPRVPSLVGRGLLVGVNVFYFWGYGKFYLKLKLKFRSPKP